MDRRLLEIETLAYDGRSFRIDWTHDANGATSGVIYPDETPVAFAPNALGQPAQAAGFATGVTYYPNGAMKSFLYGNGIEHTLTQNARQLPLRSRDVGTMDFNYAYDANANVTAIADNRPTGIEGRTMSYDGVDRLKTANASEVWGAASFSYDPLDNLRTSTVGTRSCTHAYDGLNRLTLLSGCATGYAYDVRGNVNVRTRPGYGTQTLTFDAANRLTEVVGQEKYAYDGLGHRVALRDSVSGAKRYQVYSQSGQLLYSENTADGSKTDYIYLNGSLVARNEAGPPGLDFPAPGNFTVSPNPSTTGFYTVSWNAVPNAGSYRLMQSINGGVYVAIFPSLATSWSPGTAQPTGSYRYYVQACEAECGAQSPTLTEVVTLPLGAPDPISASPNPSPNGNYTVSWHAVPGTVRYRLEERVGAGAWGAPLLLPTTSKAYTNKPPGTYLYRAKACTDTLGNVCGPYSNTETQTVQEGSPPLGEAPHAPPGLGVSPTTSADGAYTVSWGESLTATGYHLEEKFGSGGWTPVANQALRTWSPNPPKTVNGVYTYRVNACNPHGCSDWSSSQPSVTVDILLPPANVRAVPNSVVVPWSGPPETYRIRWDTVPGATYYKVKRRDLCSGPVWPDPVDYADSPARYDAYVPVYCAGASVDFYYSVRACKPGHCSDWSAEAQLHATHGGQGLQSINATYLHTDALGSPVAETNAAGAVTKRMRYEPYGAPTDQTYPQEPGYTGHVMDAKTGLIYMQQRYYDPMRGGFLSVDPARSGFSPYAYANNNPYRFIDPDGRCTGSRISNSDKTCQSTGEFTTKASSVRSSDARNVSKVFTHSSVAGETTGARSSEFPQETRSALRKFLGSSVGGTIGRYAVGSGQKIELEQILPSSGFPPEFGGGYGGGNLITYSLQWRQFLASNKFGSEFAGAGLDVLLAHEIGHTGIAGSALGYNPNSANADLNEFNAVRYVENPYRNYLQLPQRTHYSGIPIPEL